MIFGKEIHKRHRMMKLKFDDFEDSLDCMNFVNSINKLKLDVKRLKRQSLYNAQDNRYDPRSIYLENENIIDNENSKFVDEESKAHNNLLSEPQIMTIKQNLYNPYK